MQVLPRAQYTCYSGSSRAVVSAVNNRSFQAAFDPVLTSHFVLCALLTVSLVDAAALPTAVGSQLWILRNVPLTTLMGSLR